MYKLLVVVVGLLLGVGAWAQPSGKGMVAHCPTSTITSGDCAGLATGTRVYDTTLGYEVTYNGTSWVPSFGTTGGVPSQRIWFCGELGAAADEFFGGPDLIHDVDGNATVARNYGSALCNGLGDTTVGNADASIDAYLGYRVTGMKCNVSAAPGSATTVMTFVDDTVNTAVTCSIPAAGTGCVSAPGLSTLVAANSLVAISTLNPDDDESLQDFHCWVYLTWLP